MFAITMPAKVYLHSSYTCQNFKEVVWSDLMRLVKRIEQSTYEPRDSSIRRWWQEWVKNGRYQVQNGNGLPRAKVEKEDKAIVRAAVTVPNSLLSTIHCATRTYESNMTLGRWLRERNLCSWWPLWLLHAVKSY